MQLPFILLDALEGQPGFDRKAFVDVHAAGAGPTAIRVNEGKTSREAALAGMQAQSTSIRLNPVPWCRTGHYLSQRPSFTFDPLFHAGAYYVQEASSMFLEQAISQLLELDRPLRALDLCAAPGGKSTHLQSLLSTESLLVSNEVIRARCRVLTDNLIKWGGANSIVTSNDPSAFGKLNGFFDLIVVDAPCSGSGMFRKDPDALSEWSPANVVLCSQRQQRILADVLPALKEGGLLVYSTCSYSEAENEAIADWLVKEFDMDPEQLNIDPDWGVVETVTGGGAFGYRFYPYRVEGEGFYLCCLRKLGAEKEKRSRTRAPEKVSPKEAALLQPWLTEPLLLFREEGSYYALPEQHYEAYAQLKEQLAVYYKGISLGQLLKERLVPEHALSQSRLLAPTVPDHGLDYAQAIAYLQRKELPLQPPVRGWQTVSFAGQRLGWINALPQRVNNYYPKEIRILKQQNDTAFEN
jgi:16S rRNA C967 or C1407 C5-methylase (RsmB/RsmF family)/NOL1/NOP2/fmu family ribosome biogenesis protein